MNCYQARRRLAGYLDGGIGVSERASLSVHLDACDSCREDLNDYRLLVTRLANVERVAAPADLALRIRVQASFGRSRWLPVTRLWSRALMTFRNILEPLALPAAGGIVTALVIFALLVQNILVGVPVGGIVPDDLPLNLVQPAQLESLAPFPVPGIAETNGHLGSDPLLLEATLNANGEVLFYHILSGPDDAAVRSQIDQVLMFSHFRPQLGFGRPMDGGRVLLNFSGVHVPG
jgi:Putative zinc-finger